MENFLTKFRRKTPTSAKLFKESQKYMPGGVNSSARGTFTGWKPYPVFVKYGSGSRLFDVDGNEYIDYLLSLGPMILGHRPKKVTQAVSNFIFKQGSIFALPYELETEVAEKFIAAVPCAEMVRFTNTGSEAAATTVRIARAYTGRKKIIKFEGHYHGWIDTVYWSNHPKVSELGPKEAPRSVVSGPGVPACIGDTIITLPWNDIQILEKTLAEHGKEIAAIITEPLMCNTGVIEQKAGYLEKMRELATKYGIVLIFDEVITGFRLALGGAQQYYNVTPDLASFAKGFGGGFPVAAIAGKRSIMEMIAAGKYSHSGTYNANGIAMAAANATLDELARPGLYERLHALGEKLRNGLRELFSESELKVQICGVGPILQVWFSEKPIFDYRDAETYIRPQDFRVYWEQMFLEGVLFHPSQFENLFISTAHTDADIDETLEKVKKVLPVVRERINKGDYTLL